MREDICKTLCWISNISIDIYRRNISIKMFKLDLEIEPEELAEQLINIFE